MNFLFFFKYLAFFVAGNDIGKLTIKAAYDPRASNKTVHFRPSCNLLSLNEMAALWENKIGRNLPRTTLTEADLLAMAAGKFQNQYRTEDAYTNIRMKMWGILMSNYFFFVVIFPNKMKLLKPTSTFLLEVKIKNHEIGCFRQKFNALFHKLLYRIASWVYLPFSNYKFFLLVKLVSIFFWLIKITREYPSWKYRGFANTRHIHKRVPD